MDSLVSVIIPCRNEEQNIPLTIQGIAKTFEAASINYEIVIINDGSQDRTAEVVESLHKKNNRIRLVHNNPPHGIGNAIKKGLDSFWGDMVIIAMADASDEPKDMVTYVNAVKGGVDCCFGSRWNKEAVVKDYPRHKLMINRMANLFVSVLFGLKYRDITNAFKCYSRKTIEGIKPILSHHFNITVELPLKAIVRGYSYKVVPTNWYGRKVGMSSLKIKEMGSRYLFIVLYVLMEKWLVKKDYHKS